MGKSTKVLLTCQSVGEQEFEVSHAERLLGWPNNGGWHLPKESEYEYKDGSISRRNKKGVKGATKK